MTSRILVVDDQKEIRDLFSNAPTQAGGFGVDRAETAEEGLQKIRRKDFDLVLVDLKLPGMDGLQLVREIVRSRPEVVTIVITGYATVDSAIEAMKCGASDYLMKPVELQEMIHRIRKVLDEKKRFLGRNIRIGGAS